jgi:hypothetical protein
MSYVFSGAYSPLLCRIIEQVSEYSFFSVFLDTDFESLWWHTFVFCYCVKQNARKTSIDEDECNLHVRLILEGAEGAT